MALVSGVKNSCHVLPVSVVIIYVAANPNGDHPSAAVRNDNALASPKKPRYVYSQLRPASFDRTMPAPKSKSPPTASIFDASIKCMARTGSPETHVTVHRCPPFVVFHTTPA